jgi:hypothetical protein
MAPYGSSPVQVQSVLLNVEPATTARRTTVGNIRQNAEQPSHTRRWVPSYVGQPVYILKKTQTLHLRGRHSEINKHNLFPVLQNSL